MADEPSSWNAQHFSQSNAAGRGQDDIPRLLRRVANTLAKFDDIRVLDIVLHTEYTADGMWPSITVYFSREPPPEA